MLLDRCLQIVTASNYHWSKNEGPEEDPTTYRLTVDMGTQDTAKKSGWPFAKGT